MLQARPLSTSGHWAWAPGVGVPIVVGGRLWGAAVVGSSQPLPPDTEARVGDFADLVATAIANADARAELTASRARIVAAADGARRRSNAICTMVRNSGSSRSGFNYASPKRACRPSCPRWPSRSRMPLPD